ncbi:MtrAB system histidine kinase MtrB [Arcanobacterium ihumii]|uniref:MtrAB system histidine kinase MtrB n=1 Tax=Arcanobacterium ihumii TaxID=2138162 RepID=UPI000F53AB6E|nr:MtrAB system histidine kinase MtrB [Arcanobacterium ihumii]
MTQEIIEGSEKTQNIDRKQRVFERLSHTIDQIQAMWASSLRARLIVFILVGGIVGVGVTSVVITTQIRSAVFNQAAESSIKQFKSEAAIAQERFSAAASPTTGQAQQVANQLVSSMYDPSRGLIGAVLLRTVDQTPTPAQIIEPATASATKVRLLVSREIRSEVSTSHRIAWQSVKIPRDNALDLPGIVIGTSIQIPNSGSYEFYAVYSLESQQELLSTTNKVLAIAAIAMLTLILFFTVLVLRMLLRPIQEVSKNAQQLAEGEFDTRMKVKGTDEFAGLALSFNQMASSLETQFKRLERMSELQTNFVSAVSHELRSPVTTIRMAGQLIYDKREELSTSLKRSAELQHAQLINLDSMLTDLLEISRYDAGAMTLATEPTDLRDVVNHVIDIAQPLAHDNGVEVIFTADGDTTAEIEGRRVERIVRNLVVNALEHAEGAPVFVHVQGGESAVAVSVVDHGVGLTDEQAEHVFDRFWRADSSRVRKTGGTGLGLTIAREDALLHGGLLEAVGALGVGSMFLMTLPKAPGETFVKPIELHAPQPLQLPPEINLDLGVDDSLPAPEVLAVENELTEFEEDNSEDES